MNQTQANQGPAKSRIDRTRLGMTQKSVATSLEINASRAYAREAFHSLTYNGSVLGACVDFDFLRCKAFFA